ncbi:hypothetical protein ABEB36_014153 [Hypothenemus hampei]|uniref:MADF domain-containing protein n=1 Tax=Hypothenemus hampei TaxID=57062 RepID=A0ABD1E4E2_HYPHA
MSDENIDCEKLINEVQKRPGIFDKKLPEYSDRNKKEKLCNEVCQILVPSKAIQQKWKNFRDNFRKELQLQKNTVSGQATRKKRKYLYFNQLLFSLPTLEGAITSGNYETISPNENINNDSLILCHQGVEEFFRPPVQQSLLEILKQKQQPEDIDEHKTVLLSLLPSFKKLSDDQKFTVKMDFLRALQQAHKYCSQTFSHFNQTQFQQDQPQSHFQYTGLSTKRPSVNSC